MIKVLETAIAKVKDLPEERQAYAAHVLEQIVTDDSAPFQIPDDHRAGVLEGLAQAGRGEFASDEAVDNALHKSWA